jgi:hypothetical protein
MGGSCGSQGAAGGSLVSSGASWGAVEAHL